MEIKRQVEEIVKEPYTTKNPIIQQIIVRNNKKYNELRTKCVDWVTEFQLCGTDVTEECCNHFFNLLNEYKRGFEIDYYVKRKDNLIKKLIESKSFDEFREIAKKTDKDELDKIIYILMRKTCVK